MAFYLIWMEVWRRCFSISKTTVLSILYNWCIMLIINILELLLLFKKKTLKVFFFNEQSSFNIRPPCDASKSCDVFINICRYIIRCYSIVRNGDSWSKGDVFPSPCSASEKRILGCFPAGSHSRVPAMCMCIDFSLWNLFLPCPCRADEWFMRVGL